MREEIIFLFLITYLVGDLGVDAFYHIVRWLSDDREKYPQAVPRWVVGAFERTMAFLLFLFAVDNAATVLIAWMAAKLAANWQRRDLTDNERKSLWIRKRTFIALMTGVLSLAVGVAGGSMARCSMPLKEPPSYCAFVEPLYSFRKR